MGAAFSLLARQEFLSNAFGFNSQPVLVGIIIFGFVMAPYFYIVKFARNFRSQKMGMIPL